jgi:hypothetical protein
MTEDHTSMARRVQEDLLRVGQMQSEMDALMAEVQGALQKKSSELREHCAAALAEMKEITLKIRRSHHQES